jgi:dolichol-phosphate mannosyltransferase
MPVCGLSWKPSGARCPGVLRRWLMFNVVGLLGILVQLAMLLALTGLWGLNYMLGTVLAVESSVLHNFYWHERWTWADRPACGRYGRLLRLCRFNLSNGLLSILGNLVVMRFLVSILLMHYLEANLIAVAVCSILNYFAGDRFVFSSGISGAELQARK